MALLDLLGRRWSLRVLWELRSGRRTFRDLCKACEGVSPGSLNLRLHELREARLIDLEEGEGFGLAPLGTELVERFLPLVEWSERWARAARSHR
jgi:DNA-binding HxlR family transcriptional regulator